MRDVVTFSWDCEAVPFSLPLCLSLRLADIDAGSSTPKLVSAVLAWQLEHPVPGISVTLSPLSVAKRMYTKIDSLNSTLVSLFKELSEISSATPDVYTSTMIMLSKSPSSIWQSLDVSSERVKSVCLQIVDVFGNIRKYLREMGQAAGVPIEPSVQTDLLDECIKENGVIMAGVPGAGGYDAVFCLVIGDSDQVWSGKDRVRALECVLKDRGADGLKIY